MNRPMVNKGLSSQQDSKPTGKSFLKVWGSAIAVVVVGFVGAYYFVEPAPPRHIVMATGDQEGAYYAFGQRYRKLLAESGITLELRSTAGSIENLELLESDADEVSIAFVQGGTVPADSANRLEALASLYFEPVWVFHRGDEPMERLVEVRGKRVAIGELGSGVRAIATQLLEENGISLESGTTEMLSIGGPEAVEALQQGKIDVAFFVVSPLSPLVRELIESEGIQLMSFRRHLAYERKYPFLSSVILAEGMLDMRENIPSQDAVLLAPTASLVARKDLHPALVWPLLEAASTIHESGGLLSQPGRFPSPRYVDLPLSAEARHFFKAGPSLLQRYLPFWAASFIDRMKIMLLPLITLLLPLMKLAPPTYVWQIRQRIYRWYGVLRAVDQKLKGSDSHQSLEDAIATLRQLEEEVAKVNVPLSYMEEFYNLRIHIGFMLDRLRKLSQARQSTSNATGKPVGVQGAESPEAESLHTVQ